MSRITLAIQVMEESPGILATELIDAIAVWL